MFEIIKYTIEFIVTNIDKCLSEPDIFKTVVQGLINSICQEIISNNISRLDLNPKNIYELIGYLNKLLTLAQKIQALQSPSNLNKSEMEGLINQLKTVMKQLSQRFLFPSLGGTNSGTLTAPSDPTPSETTTTQTNVQIYVETTSISDNTIYYTINSIIVTTNIFEKYTYPELPTTLISSTIEYPNTYTFPSEYYTLYPVPSGYDTLDLWYTFTDSQSNQINEPGTMSNETSPITVSLDEKFSQTFTGLTSGQSYTFYFPYSARINYNNTFVYYVASLNPFTYTTP
jgi:hypothetical protein